MTDCLRQAKVLHADHAAKLLSSTALLFVVREKWNRLFSGHVSRFFVTYLLRTDEAPAARCR